MISLSSDLIFLHSGVMRITVTVVVIMFELTGALTYILPTMVSYQLHSGDDRTFFKFAVSSSRLFFWSLKPLEISWEPMELPMR